MALLGEIVSAASGMPYDSHVQQRILEPLGMTDTTTDIPLQLAGGQLATGYSPLDRSGQRHSLALFQTRAIAPAAGYASTVEDLGRFCRLAVWPSRHRMGLSGGIGSRSLHPATQHPSRDAAGAPGRSLSCLPASVHTGGSGLVFTLEMTSKL